MKIRILFLLMLAICLQVGAQNQIVFQSDQSKSYLLSFANTNDESQRIINEMLEAIAKHIPKPVFQTKVTFTVDESVKITRDGKLLTIYVDHQNIKMDGDVFLNGFAMNDVLLPAKYEFVARLSRKNGPLLADFTPPKADFKIPFNEVMLQFTDTLPQNNYKFDITSTKFSYDRESLQRFRERMGYIDQYFAADVDLSNINRQLSDINPNGIDAMDITQASLNAMKIRIDQIEDAGFWRELHIENHDALKLKFKLHEVRERFDDIQRQASHTLSIIYQLFYDRGEDFYNNKRTLEAKTAFEKSLFYNPNFAPAQYYVALIAFESNKTDEAKQEIKKLFGFRNMDDYTLQSAKRLANAIEWTDMNIADGLLTNRQYADALTAVAKAESFCRSLPNYACNDTIELIRGSCHQGIYSDKTTVAENLFEQRRFSEAETAVDNALQYQQKYANYIRTNEAAMDIKEKIRIAQYADAIQKGKDEMALKNYRAAFDDFNKAKGIEDQYPVTKNKLLPDLIKKSKAEVLLLDVADAENAVKVNNLTNARTILRQVMDDQSTYSLYDNTKLTQRIDALKKSILSQECDNAQRDYDTKVAAASRAENEKSYVTADDSYSQALQTIDRNPDCGINGNSARTGKLNVEKPASYQRQFNQCNDMVKNFNYLGAIEAYKKLGDYFTTNTMSSFGFTYQPLHLYIASFESGFALSGMSYFTNAADLEHAMYLMKLLRQRNMKKEATKFQQMELARALAINDYKTNPGFDAKLKVSEYTLGDKWYSYFSSEYLKQVKKFK